MSEPRATARTRSGNFRIGFRRLNGPWLNDIQATIDFTREHAFACVDVGALPLPDLKRIIDAGLTIGSVDLPAPWSEMICEDPGHRAKMAIAAGDYARRVHEQLGINTFFSVAIPRDFARSRRDNFSFAVDAFARIAKMLESSGARVVLEGWPGPAPQFASIGCTPADCRALLAAINSPAIGINYDPSHLLRMNIDPLRFIDEFAAHIFHAHAKDTLIDKESLYEHGTLQPPTFAEFKRWSGPGWRYTAPGQGSLSWTPLLQRLAQSGYRGLLSIELEDQSYNGAEAGERAGLIASRDFLISA